MTMNSTISELVQDNSNVTTETNPMDTVQNSDLVFGHTHNGVKCAACPTAKRACDRAWFSAKQIEEWSEMSKKTLWRWLEKLEKARRIASVSDMTQTYIQDSCGVPHETTLYNLNVLNQLAMVCIDNEKLNEVSCKFSDILSEVETTGSYTVNQTQQQPMMLPNFCNPAEAARAWADLYEKNQAIELRALTAESERDETKALLAEEKEKNEYLERSKSWIGDKKVASAMGTAGALSKKCDRLEKELDKVKSGMELQVYNAREAIRKEYEDAWMTARDWCYNHKITVKINEPKWAVSAKLTKICEAHPDRDQWRRDARGTKLFPKWACDILDKVYDEDDTFLSEYRIV